MTGAVAATGTGSFTWIVRVAVPVPPGPVAERPTVYVPSAMGTPVIWPFAGLTLRPGGRLVAP